MKSLILSFVLFLGIGSTYSQSTYFPLIETGKTWHVLDGGFGSGVLELLSEKDISKPVFCIGLPTEFIGQGKRSELLEEYGLTPRKIYQVIKGRCRQK